MNNPKGQYDKIKNLKNIHYVLPTFANRLWDENALYHCFFWRPKQNDNYKTVWYKQYSTRSIVARCRNDFYRWGTFIEKLYNKEIGQSIKQLDNQTLNGYIHDFVDNYNKIDVDLSDNLNSEFSESLKKTEKEQSEMLYFLHLKI